MAKILVLTGQRFGRLTVLRRAENNARGGARWVCLCECGGETVALGSDLRKGHTQSCGCYRMEQATLAKLDHGDSAVADGACAPEYTAWVQMKGRCLNPRNESYANYGGRGITVCDRWICSYSNFLEDMGRRPGPGYTLERKDVNLGYCPENCTWIHRSRQACNTRNSVWLEYRGERMILADWAKRLGMRVNTLWARLYVSGWSVEKALTAPLRGYSVRSG